MNIFKNISLIVLVFALALTSCSKTDDDGQGNNVNDMDMVDDANDNDGNALDDAPDFSAETTDGTAINSSQFEGKTLVIFFFGSSCGPCISVGPNVESKLYQEFKNNDNFAMIGLDQWDGSSATVDDFQDKTGVTFPLGVKSSSIARDFGTTYDRLVIVNSDGKIDYKGNSIAANNLDDVIKRVNELL